MGTSWHGIDLTLYVSLWDPQRRASLASTTVSETRPPASWHYSPVPAHFQSEHVPLLICFSCLECTTLISRSTVCQHVEASSTCSHLLLCSAFQTRPHQLSHSQYERGKEGWRRKKGKERKSFPRGMRMRPILDERGDWVGNVPSMGSFRRMRTYSIPEMLPRGSAAW